MTHAFDPAARMPADLAMSCEKLLDGFEPNFKFTHIDPLPEAEFAERLRRLRREAVVANHDVVLMHTDIIGWYHTSNSYLRYICDWAREGILVIPSDEGEAMTLFSFFGTSVLLPPAGEPVLVEDIWQVGPWGREYFDRPGVTSVKTAEAVAAHLVDRGWGRGQIGLVGDRTSPPYWSALAAALPQARLVNDNSLMANVQRRRTKREQALVRGAAQLLDIGLQAAYHVIKPGVTDHEIYAAFTYAQLARGGETGDGYQIGVNRWGTHCGKPYGHIVKPGDLINLYISKVTYRGYDAQAARMIAVGDITKKQEETAELCAEGLRRAIAQVRPGALARTVNNACFEPFIERGWLKDAEARTMPFNWEAMPDGSPRKIPTQHVPCGDWERQGRRLNHVYPAQYGPHNPNVGHAVSMFGMFNYNLGSNNYDVLEEGMTFVLHPQWLQPLESGCNIGNCCLVTDDGVEVLDRHTPAELHRVPV